MSDPAPAAAQTTAQPTPLYDLHRELGGRMVAFADWLLPVQYRAGIMAEHRHCRSGAALFDISHMGQVIVHGTDAAEAFESLVPANIVGLVEGRSRYTMFTNEAGGVLDDLIVGRVREGLSVVINAACRAADLAHMRAALEGAHRVQELTDRALLALQGPHAAAVLARLAPVASTNLAFMAMAEVELAGIPCRIARCGYTGEDGFEISVPAGRAEALARRLLQEQEVEPAGLGARDSLRLEAGLCLYGHELTPEITPVEARLGWTIPKRRREQGGFPGAAVIQRQLAEGTARQLVGIRPTGRAPAREHTAVLGPGGRRIGEVTSGGFGPTVEGPIAMAYLESAHAAPGTEVQLVIRDRPQPAQVVELPFVPHRYQR